MSKRIVVTGMGALTPLGSSVESTWQRLLDGQSGIRRLPQELIGDLAVSIGGQVQSALQDPEAGFDPDRLLAAKEQRKMDRFILFALAAADEALKQANWAPKTPEEQARTATIIASGVGGFPAIADAVQGDLKILADSGIRNGLDVVRMLALGADSVLLGRAFVYALAAQGEAGAANLLDLIAREMRVAMTLTGARRIADIGRDLLAKLPG